MSNVLIPQGTDHPFEQSVHICHGNWSSADSDLDTLTSLVNDEIAKGWLFEVSSWDEALERFGGKVAIGKMAIARAPGKSPRLVVDSTVCGTNPSCFIPETFGLPGVEDVRECFPLRMHRGMLAAFALDIKSAHKIILVRPCDQGLPGVSLPRPNHEQPRLLIYRVCPFGANFSALWFQRLGDLTHLGVGSTRPLWICGRLYACAG